ncbi:MULTISPECIES: YbeU/YbeR family protein [Cobetia]|uniref:DUF1266 domain-containing protein n=2 Tax=Cobetia crustatorum TaxID=553385 RepID=A0A558HJH9_9GAMM|nr:MULTISPECIES: YbeU/YbeR family protein [Cobetia]TVU69289.1 DUF1266 domain-containing protein [Cobetia crustatorum]
MVEPLSAWWGQQLVLCGWGFSAAPETVWTPEEARARLTAMEVPDAGELGWRLLEAFPNDTPDPLHQLEALELLALARTAGWLSAARTRGWQLRLLTAIAGHFSSLDDWLKALAHSRSDAGWTRGDDGFFEASLALSQLEHEDAGVTWSRLQTALEDISTVPATELWPQGERDRVWMARAIFSPWVGGHDVVRDASGLCEAAESGFSAEAHWPDVQRWLSDTWAITGRDELIRLLLWLAAQGHRYGWDIDSARLLGASGSERAAWLSELENDAVEEAAARKAEGNKGPPAHAAASAELADSALEQGPSPVAYGELLLNYMDRGEPLEFAAWDWLRLVDLSFAGLCAGWLSREEGEDFAAHGVDLLVRRYADWQGVARAYQRGRGLFEGADLMHDTDSDWRPLVSSPLTPLRCQLHALLPDHLRERSRTAIRRWRSDSRHWVLAIASIREPDILYRQGLSSDIDEPRREEARQYLNETLALDTRDGAQGMARFWLPAQAHHLNQLAADAARGALPDAQTPFGRADSVELERRQRLAICHRHPATIVMAEKYAFYLLMVQDTTDFVVEELAECAERLRSVLCRFYPDARRLLEAWAVWESAVPELEDHPLANEIRWHLEDPGSLFHWLDWHPRAWEEPGLRPSLDRFTSLALSGPLNTPCWGEPMVEYGRGIEELSGWLEGHYGLGNAEMLTGFLDFLRDAGDRDEYLINYGPYTLNRSRLDNEIAVLESAERGDDEQVHLDRLRRVRDNEARCNELDMAAWDIAQMVDLAIAGRQLGWLDEVAFTAYLDTAYDMARDHYGSWKEYARGLFAGYAFFMGDTDQRDSFLRGFRDALIQWLTAAPPLAGAWSSLDFPGARPGHWPALHLDILSGDARTLH